MSPEHLSALLSGAVFTPPPPLPLPPPSVVRRPLLFYYACIFRRLLLVPLLAASDRPTPLLPAPMTAPMKGAPACSLACVLVCSSYLTSVKRSWKAVQPRGFGTTTQGRVVLSKYIVDLYLNSPPAWYKFYMHFIMK